MTDLKDLARRVSELQGPSREMDAEIALAKGWLEFKPDWFRPPNSEVQHHRTELPRYTASLDAAMTLVADGKLISLETYDDNGVYPEHVRASAWVQGAPRQFAASPALALTAAALIARSEAHVHD